MYGACPRCQIHAGSQNFVHSNEDVVDPDSTAPSNNFKWGNYTFSIVAETPGGDYIPGFVFQQPVTVALHYDPTGVLSRGDVDVVDSAEQQARDAFMPTLQLFDTVTQTWRSVTEFCPPEHRAIVIDYQAHTATFQVCHLTQFGLFFQQRPVIVQHYDGPAGVLLNPHASAAFALGAHSGLAEKVSTQMVRVVTTNDPAVAVVVLDASSSYDPDGVIANVTWTLLPLLGHCSTPQMEIARPSNLTISASGFSHCVYGLHLLVVDNDGGEADRLTIIRFNAHPVALPAVPTELLVFPDTYAAVDGSASVDPEGAPLMFLWTLVAAPDRTTDLGTSVPPPDFSDAREAVTDFGYLDKTGNYSVNLLVEDGEGGTDNVTVTFGFNLPPIPHIT